MTDRNRRTTNRPDRPPAGYISCFPSCFPFSLPSAGISPAEPATRRLARKTLAAQAVRTTPQNRLAGPAMPPAASRIRFRLPPRNINGAFELRNPLIYWLLMKTKSCRPTGHDGFCCEISVKFVRINKALRGKLACCRRLLMFLSGCFFATLHPLSVTSAETAISTGS